MRSAGKDIAINELKVGDRVRIEPTPGAGADEPTRTASRLEVLGTSASGSAQRTVSTERPVLGESSDAGEDRDAMPSSAGSTTGRTVSTDRPVLGQSPPPETTTTGSTSINTTGTSTYGSSTTPAGTSSTTSSTNSQTSADELPATASPLPMLGVLGLLALAAGFAVRATRKQHS
jgi:hypothetical protein